MKLHETAKAKPLLIVFSHLRWDFVFQRPQQILTRAANDFDVVFMEEPIVMGLTNTTRVRRPWTGVTIVQPLVPEGSDAESVLRFQESIVDTIVSRAVGVAIYLWYYTPAAYAYSANVPADLIIFDKMDELTAFAFAPAGLARLESDLLGVADLVFTGGASLYEAAVGQHPSVHCFPSSIDASHFGCARTGAHQPADLAAIAGPRLGYVGVIDERIDLQLISDVAEEYPALSIVMIGPTAKIDPATLPNAPNIYWLGPKAYAQLPDYMAHWDLAWMPFALNDATRYISPTKTPEYLAAGLPVISTEIRDVVEPYGRLGLVEIEGSARGVIACVSRLLARSADAEANSRWLEKVDCHLAGNSWDKTWQSMRALIGEAATASEIATSEVALLKQGADHV